MLVNRPHLLHGVQLRCQADCVSLRIVPTSEGCVSVLKITVIGQISIDCASLVLQTLDWSCEVNFTLEELLIRHLIDGWLALRMGWRQHVTVRELLPRRQLLMATMIGVTL